MWDDTVVLFTSDHGDMMGAHGFRLKGVPPYDELFRIPFQLKVPGLSPSRQVVDDLCVNVAQPGTLLAVLNDLAADPGEVHNVVDRADVGHVRDDLRRRVDDWWASTGGRELDHYESDTFKTWGEATLHRDNALWTDHDSAR